MMLAPPPLFRHSPRDTVKVLVALIVPCVWLVLLDRVLRRNR